MRNNGKKKRKVLGGGRLPSGGPHDIEALGAGGMKASGGLKSLKNIKKKGKEKEN